MPARRYLVSTVVAVTALAGAFAASAQADTTRTPTVALPCSATIQPAYGNYGVGCVVGDPANGFYGGANVTDGSPLQVSADALYCTTTSTGRYLCAGGAQWVDPLRADGGTLVCYGLSCAFVKP